MKPQIAFCTTADGVRIAWSSVGTGSPIIRTSHWMTHLDHDLQSPIWRHALLLLARHHRLISYDARGEGRSQRDVDSISFAGWMADLEAVVEASGLERFALFGASQGAATAIAYAVANPERVSHLILYGAFSDNRRRWDDTESLELACGLIRKGWGSRHDAYRQWFASRFLPEGDIESFRYFNWMQQQSATPETAERHLRASAEINVTALLPKVRVPTLVLHCRGDIIAPIACGEEIAAAIPGARFVPLSGNNHLFRAGSPAHREFAEAVADFLGDPPPPRQLPGQSLHQRAASAVGAVERNWLIKLIILLGALVGLGLSLAQVGGILG